MITNKISMLLSTKLFVSDMARSGYIGWLSVSSFPKLSHSKKFRIVFNFSLKQLIHRYVFHLRMIISVSAFTINLSWNGIPAA